MIQIIRQSNSEVTDYYLDVIAQMCSDGADIYDRNHKLEDCSKTDVVIVPTANDFLRAYKLGYRKIIYWMQGLDGEESYLKHHSILRKKVLDFLTWFALKNARAIFYVSEEMRRYVERKFRMQTIEKSFVMPCFNVTKENGSSFSEEKYQKNIFSYVGSLSKWQCFPETVELYKKIEQKYKDTEFRVFTFSVKEAEEICKEKGIERYSVATVAPEHMTEALKDVKFGFVLRENIAVNNVATPTKLSSYLSAGVIPVFSIYLSDFYERTKLCEYVIPVADSEISEKLDSLITGVVDVKQLSREYDELFSTYYNPAYYAEKHRLKLRDILEIKNED